MDPSTNYVADRVIVKFKSIAPVAWKAVTRMLTPQGQGQAILARLGVAETAALASVGGSVISGVERVGILLVKTSVPVPKAIEALRRSRLVEYVEPDYRISLAAVPNDPQFNNLWGLSNTGQPIDGGNLGAGTAGAEVHAPLAWDAKTDSSSVVVVVLDTGVDYTHEDLAGNMWKNPSELAGNGIDDDGNGYVDDVYGIDTYNGDADPLDDHGHGTQVAGIIGAVGNNGVGVAGLGWKAKLMALKFAAGNGYASDYAAASAIYYALDIKQANAYPRMIINESWETCCGSSALQGAISSANLAGVLFVTAAGNDGRNIDIDPVYPAAYGFPNMIVVGASDFNDQPASFSNKGCSSVHLFAPGVNILSTQPGNIYGYDSGTSLATAYVSGIAALSWSRGLARTAADVKSALLNGANAKAVMKGLAVSGGRANANAINFTKPAVWSVTPAQVNPGATLTITGNRFGATAGSVTVDNVAASIVSWSNSQIQATLDPSTLAGPHKVKVTAATGDASVAGGCTNTVYGEALVDRLLVPRSSAAGAQVGNDVYIMGGETNYGLTGMVERYTLDTGRSVIDSDWDMPFPVHDASAALIGTKIYVVGGYGESGPSNRLQIFDTATGTWTLGANLPASLYRSAAAAANGKLHVFGGYQDYYERSAATYVYGPNANKWTTGTPLPMPLNFASAARQGTGATIFVAGGFAGDAWNSTLTNEVLAYNATTGVWSDKPDLVVRRYGFALVPHTNNRFVALHGGGYQGVADSELFASNAWKIAIQGENGLVFVPLGGRVGNDFYTLGGNDSWGYSANVWKTTVP